MSLTQANDFLEESEALHGALADLDEAAFETATQFKGWTLNDVLVHLHFWNEAADLAARDEAAFRALMAEMMGAISGGDLRSFENARILERGAALRALWIGKAREMAPRWAAMDPKARLPWVGPSMSARSAMTARQMETWAHGFEIFDRLGQRRRETDRIRNIVVLGVNTFGWSHQVRGMAIPEAMPELVLAAPSGATWRFGAAGAGRISGPAADFAAVVTQTRAFEDTALEAEGPIARAWMANAQCFAGPPETPPAPGTRHEEARDG